MSQEKGVILSGNSRRTMGRIKGNCLVVCFTQIGAVANPMWYSFKSCLIESLIGHSSTKKQLKDEFVWREDPSAASRCHYVEIDGRIYTLSAPLPCYGNDVVDINFKVYDPPTDKWTRLKSPHFLPEGTLAYSRSFKGSYAHVVIDKKLCIATGDLSCAHDIEHRKWEACDLFRDFQSEDFTPPFDDCGPPFPFVGKAIVHKKDILVCNMPSIQPPVVALRVVDGKAQRMPPLVNSMPLGDVVDIVDLGGGYFSVMLFEKEMIYSRECLTFVTFKLSKTGLICGQPWKSTWRVGLGKKGPMCHPIYSFTL